MRAKPGQGGWEGQGADPRHLEQHIGPDSPALERSGAEILAQHIRLFREPQKKRRPLGALQIKRDGALVAPLVEPQERISRLTGRRAEPAQRIAARGVLHLDHLGAELR